MADHDAHIRDGNYGLSGDLFAEDLVQQGHDVAVLPRAGTRPWRLEAILDHLSLIEGTLDDPAALGNGFRSFAPDAVIHTAWRAIQSKDATS